MTLLKTGAYYPLTVVSSFTYNCSDKNCKFSRTILVGDKFDDVCAICGCKMRLVSSHTEAKPKRD